MAYGASLESWLGASPRGFESPILRSEKAPDFSGAFVLLGVQPLVRGVSITGCWL